MYEKRNLNCYKIVKNLSNVMIVWSKKHVGFIGNNFSFKI